MRDMTFQGAPGSDLAAVLAQVRADFIRRTEGQIDEFRPLRARITEANGGTAREFLRFEAHRICGIARTLGFWQLGDSAERLEAALTPDPAPGRPGDVVALLDRLIGDMVALGAAQ